MTKKKLVFLYSFIVLLSLSHGITHAQIWDGRYEVTCNVPRYDNGIASNACTLCDGMKLIINIIDFLTKIAVTLAVVFIIWGGFTMLRAGGSEETFRRGRSSVYSALVGLLITLASWIIVNEAIVLLSGNVALPWSKIKC